MKSLILMTEAICDPQAYIQCSTSSGSLQAADKSKSIK